MHLCTVFDFLCYRLSIHFRVIRSVAKMSSSTSGYSAAYLKENKSANILAPMWALTMITTGTVIARVYIRVKIVKNMGLDDWVIMVGMVRVSLLRLTIGNRCLTFTAFWSRLSRHHDRECHRRLWKTCRDIRSSSSRKSHFAQYSRLSLRHYLIHHSQGCGGYHADSNPQPQQNSQILHLRTYKFCCMHGSCLHPSFVHRV